MIHGTAEAVVEHGAMPEQGAAELETLTSTINDLSWPVRNILRAVQAEG